MEYVATHLIPIVISGVALAVICAVWAFASAKWHEIKKAEGIEDAAGCGMGCPGCAFVSQCGKSREDAGGCSAGPQETV